MNVLKGTRGQALIAVLSVTFFTPEMTDAFFDGDAKPDAKKPPGENSAPR